MAKSINIATPSHTQNLKSIITKGFKDSLKAKALWGLVFALVFTSAALAVAYRCSPCSQNYYCQAGVSYECPPETPVTISTGVNNVKECVTCTQRDGESYPAYDDVSGNCMACWQIDIDKPYWNGSKCVVCPGNGSWDKEHLICTNVEPEAQCQFEIPYNNTSLCLVESASASDYESAAPATAADETDGFLLKYGITNKGSNYPSYWAGAMKYCQDKGLRLPTMDELITILNAVYNTTKTCETACQGSSSSITSCCDFSNLTISDTALFYWLGSNSKETDAGNAYIYSSDELNSGTSYARDFYTTYSYYVKARHDNPNKNYRALCIK